MPYPLYPEVTYNTGEDSDSEICGYYATFEWTGYGVMQFDIYSNIAKNLLEAVGFLVLISTSANLV